LLYGSDDELVAGALPFLREGTEAGEATVLGVGGREQRLILDAMDDTGGVMPLPWDEVYASPFVALEANHRVVNDLLGSGAPRVRVLGAVPAVGTPAEWDGWARYEAAINHFHESLGVWSMCPYDTRRTPDHVLADVERTHTHLTGAALDRAENPSYVEPEAFLAERAGRGGDPLEAEAPHAAERDPSPGEARRMVAALAATTDLDAARVSRLLLAVSEVVTNARLHGAGPVDVRGWAGDDRVVVTVRDRGPGPGDPFVGFLPRRDRPGGLGLWMAHQACSRVAFLHEDDGFTVRLTAEVPGDRPRD
jgi:anti-sigma regulatory factor (Ser/Thr protein kinase)